MDSRGRFCNNDPGLLVAMSSGVNSQRYVHSRVAGLAAAGLNTGPVLRRPPTLPIMVGWVY